MEKEATVLDSLFEHAESYIKSNIRLLKLNLVEKSANIFSSLLFMLIIIFSLVLIVLMINVGAAIWIGNIINSSFLGFFIVALFNCLVLTAFCIFKRSLVKEPLYNILIKLLRKGINI